MPSLDHLLGLHREIPNPRRAEGKLYELVHVRLVTVRCQPDGEPRLQPN